MLGLFSFNAGSSGNVTLTYDGESGTASADAVKFVLVQGEAEGYSEIIIDNHDSEFTTNGSWLESGASDEYAESSLYSKTLGNSATWTPTLAEAGSYAVYVWYTGSNQYDRDTNADYTVNHAGGSKTIVIDQNQGSGEWVMLGLFSFNAGSSGNVTLSHDVESVRSTSADAVKFVQSGDVIHRGQIKDSLTGNGLENVKVTVDGSTTTSDENGFYTLYNLTISEETVVNFKKEGYLLGSTKIKLKPLSGTNTNYLEYPMHAHNDQWDYDSTGEITDAHIMIDTSVSYLDSNGKSYTGTNTAELTYLNIISDEGKAVFPGAFQGINSNGTMVQFDSYGLISISLKDSSRNTLSLADGETATLGFDNFSSLDKPDTLPLWYYDYEQGLWFEEGYAQLQEDGSYKGEVSHLGVWSLNKPLEDEPGIYSGHIFNEDGTPATDVRINAIGDNWIGTDLSTDEDGAFEIKVIPGKNFTLKAYNYKDKYEASYNGTIPAIASGEIIEI